MSTPTRALTLLFAAAFTVAACSDSSNVGPDLEPGVAQVPIHVTADPSLSALVVEIAAADITTPLSYNLTMVDGSASDTITVPVGADRMITVRGYDTGNVETHRGSTVRDVTVSSNRAVTIQLDPLVGDQPVVVVLGSITLAVSPMAGAVPVGRTIQLSGAVLDDAGDTLEVSPVWSTLHPAVAAVNPAGLVTGESVGSATVLVTFGGVGASAAISVSDYVAFATCGDPMMDQDGNIYGTVEVDGLCWFSENLATSTYTNGDAIPEVQDSLTWAATGAGAWAHPNNDSAMDAKWGKLYNHWAIADSRGVCPDSWHLPTRTEIETLLAAAGATGSPPWTDPEPIHALMSVSGWPDGVTGTNSLGFNARPAGLRYGSVVTSYGASQGWDVGEFLFVGSRSAWHGSTPHPTEPDRNWGFNLMEGYLNIDRSNPNQGASVRCVRSAG